MKKNQYFQDFIYSICQYWVNQGCLWSQSYDVPMGAGTFHPHTFFKALGPEPWRSVYVQPCRRPVDGRYGKSPNRLQHYYQLQVIIKPAPEDILDVYLKSLQHVGIVLKKNDISLYEDNWKGPTLGAWGLGWEVRANGEEITQFTYFQEFAGLQVDLTTCEITYGLERIFMYAYGYKNIMDIPYNQYYTYGDIFYQNEFEFSYFNFKFADTKILFEQFEILKTKVIELSEKNLALPAYDYVLQASHLFNLLDARGALSVTERQRFLGKVRDCAKQCAIVYLNDRKEKEYPDSNKFDKIKSKTIKSTLQAYKAKTNSNLSFNILLEIGVEEIPPAFQAFAQKSLELKMSAEKIKFSEKYSHDDIFVKKISKMEIKILISARRIAFICQNVPESTPEQLLELWGPVKHVAQDENNQLTQAGIGFCKKNNLSEKDVLYKQKPSNQQIFLYAQKKLDSLNFPTIFVNELKNCLYNLDIPLKMRWLPSDVSPAFIRPVRWILCLVNNKVFPVEMFGVKSSAYTYGQRVLTPAHVQINNVLQYEKKLNTLFVVPCRDMRKEQIQKQSLKLIKKLGKNIAISDDDQLLEKCVGLTESPHVFLGKFDIKYLKLPEKLIISVLKEHMNYFSLVDTATNKLVPYYIGVANYKCLDIKTMIEGTQKVVTSRLEDGAFYFDSDLNTPFTSLRETLKLQVFQEGLGSLFDKSERLALFVKYIAQLENEKKSNTFSNIDLECLESAARHCKNDLRTGCVQEFPDEMQGVMGGVLVRAQNVFEDIEKSESIASMIEQHYYPMNASSSIPTTKLACILALADKLDSLILFLSGGYEPKGNHDPFGLRRLAIGVVRILGLQDDANCFSCSFDELLTIWNTHCVQEHFLDQNQISSFFMDRVKSLLKESFNSNSIESVSHILTKKPFRIFVPLLKALEKSTTKMESFIPYKRARSMTQEFFEHCDVNPALFVSDTEHALYTLYLTVQKNTLNLFEQEQFESFFQELFLIAEPLAKFFDSVLVNDPDLKIRQNRLCLLFKIRKLYEDVVNFSVMQVVSSNE